MVIVAIASACVMFSCGFKHSKTILIARLIGACDTGAGAGCSLVTHEIFGRAGGDPNEGWACSALYQVNPAFSRVRYFQVWSWQLYGIARDYAERLTWRDRHTQRFSSRNGYWDWLGLLMLIAVVVQVLRTVPRKARNDELALCLVGISVTLLGLLMVIHNLYSKESLLSVSDSGWPRVFGSSPLGKVQAELGQSTILSIASGQVINQINAISKTTTSFVTETGKKKNQNYV